jgi:hypothetical protein
MIVDLGELGPSQGLQISKIGNLHGGNSGRMSEVRTTDIVARPGGVMTDEVGAVTGELTLRTELSDDGSVHQRVQYRGADEWYEVTGSRTTLADGRTLDEIHAEMVGQLGRS